MDARTSDAEADALLRQVEAEPGERLSPLHAGLPGEVACNDSGRCLESVQPLGRFWSEYDRFRHRTDEMFLEAAPVWRHEKLDPVLARLRQAHPTRTLHLRMETCGFAGSPLFLIGLIDHCVRTGDLVLRQVFARTYQEEAAVLRSLLERLGADTLLVSFNGKGFDWPFVKDRLARHRLPLDQPPDHVDLLHVCRGRWRDRLNNCKLQTLERFVCGRRRSGTLSGRMVAEAYHEFVRTGADHHIVKILRHNALDVLTMVQLTAAVLDPADPPGLPAPRRVA